MAEAKFTPGPWDLSRVRRSHRRINAPHWGALAKVYVKVDDSPSEEGEANAALIAAAPDLYEALKNITDCYGVGSTPDDFCKNVLPFMAEGRAALAKARGES